MEAKFFFNMINYSVFFDVLLGYRSGMVFILCCFSTQFFPKCNWKYFVLNSFGTVCINISFLEILTTVGCYVREIGHSGLIFSILECLKWKLELFCVMLSRWLRVATLRGSSEMQVHLFHKGKVLSYKRNGHD